MAIHDWYEWPHKTKVTLGDKEAAPGAGRKAV